MSNNGTCTPAQLQRMRSEEQDFLLLDVREPQEVEIVSLLNARVVPMRQVPDRLDELEPWRDKTVVVMCHHGVRSGQVQGYLLSQGFSDVRNLTGGIHAYATQVDPTLATY